MEIVPITKSIEEQNIENEMKMKYGFIMLKPDSVDLGVTEFLIEYMRDKLKNLYDIEMEGVYILDNINIENYHKLYPGLETHTLTLMKEYLTSNSSVMVVFKDNESKYDIWDIIKKIKGPRMRDWTIDELRSGVGVERFIRGMVPVPSTREIFTPIIERIISQKERGESMQLNEDDFQIYSRNLMHSPDTLEEVIGLLSFLDCDQISEFMNTDEQNLVYNLMNHYNIF